MIEIRTSDEIEKIRTAGKIVQKVLIALSNKAVPGITTEALNAIAEDLIAKDASRPAFKGYRGYPKSICTSINDSIVHEIPSKNRILKAGDIIGFDVGVVKDGYYADAAVTVGVGNVSSQAQKLMDVTKESLDMALEAAKEGNRLSDVSFAVQEHVEKNGFSVVRHFVGHGIGRALHEEPEIPNFGVPDRGPKLKEGMILAIEPMVNQGHFDIRILKDGWTAVTKDGSLSAHFEHTVVVRKEKAEILA